MTDTPDTPETLLAADKFANGLAKDDDRDYGRLVTGWLAGYRAHASEPCTDCANTTLQRDALYSVWEQARRNHATYSATGDKESDIRFFALGLAGEAGEVANFVKKRWRDGDGHDDALRMEVADVCAYAFMLADTLGMTPADLLAMIAHKQQVFIEKMAARKSLAAVPAPKEAK